MGSGGLGDFVVANVQRNAAAGLTGQVTGVILTIVAVCPLGAIGVQFPDWR